MTLASLIVTLLLAVPLFVTLRFVRRLTLGQQAGVAYCLAVSIGLSGYYAYVISGRPFAHFLPVQWLLVSGSLLACLGILYAKGWGRVLYLALLPAVYSQFLVEIGHRLDLRGPDLPPAGFVFAIVYVVVARLLTTPAALAAFGVKLPCSAFQRITRTLLVLTVFMSIFTLGALWSGTPVRVADASYLEQQLKQEQMTRFTAILYLWTSSYLLAALVLAFPNRRPVAARATPDSD